MTELLLALAAGLLTVAAPCVLPLLPVVLGGSLSVHPSRLRPLLITAGFVAAFTGFTLVFSLFTHFLGLSPDTLRHLAIAGLLLFGTLMIWPALLQRLMQRWGLTGGRAAAMDGTGHWGAFLLGLSLGAVWTPCAGPVLGAILTLLATAPEPQRAAVLLLFYAVGAAVPMLAIGYGGRWVAQRVRAVARHLPAVQRGAGVLVIVVALAMAFQVDILATSWLLGFLPSLSQGL